MRILEWIGNFFGRTVAPPPDGPGPVPRGLVGTDWACWRYGVLGGLDDDDAAALARTFVAGYSAAFDRLGDATLERPAIDEGAWRRIARDLDRYFEALGLAIVEPPATRARGGPSRGDLGRRPTTPLPGGLLACDLGVYVEPERGLS